MKLNVEGMTCQGCVRSVGRVIARQTELPESDVVVSLDAKTAEFADIATEQVAKVLEALGKAGFPATVLN
jgi:copper chaperone CopZ